MKILDWVLEYGYPSMIIMLFIYNFFTSLNFNSNNEPTSWNIVSKIIITLSSGVIFKEIYKLIIRHLTTLIKT
ncbi:hypothetical protein DCC35_16935 [Mangrovivirga cuniculi]|uniref:Uncharacterized protein n=1 Tax=Mangrovivirga cuniculi TaxID=2715131 RepID=A0A4D7JUN9_9BACT|nr:hypothetical protein DCC35_16935 [Mangrovivirga cuniculi]